MDVTSLNITLERGSDLLHYRLNDNLTICSRIPLCLPIFCDPLSILSALDATWSKIKPDDYFYVLASDTDRPAPGDLVFWFANKTTWYF